ncbi:hypothetical protein [Paractinoplanes durhamensis]|uniref:Uncharacterized protein n=1 Tax=Paractinoplanes durhamensis TaxID=113563 RepID=A0ABQ3YXX6_9ACTN|nr:hypothetical protein [Actinoplanes durhamensis]GIE02406.1 hypothetical protein Adu01nite_37560 [Actinoplanes durhamensis]
MLLAWPGFHLGGRWVSMAELFGSGEQLTAGGGFTGGDGEMFFAAVARTAVDWDGAAHGLILTADRGYTSAARWTNGEPGQGIRRRTAGSVTIGP